MKNASFYLEMLNNNDLGSVRLQIMKDARDDIADIIADSIRYADDYDLYYSFKDCSLLDNIHPMDELDDVFDYMSPTEVLEELCEIDTSDSWFDEDTKISSDYLKSLVQIDVQSLAQEVMDGMIDGFEDDEILDILEDMNDMIDMIGEYSKKYETAKALFEQAMSNNADEVISALWNINA